MGEFNSSMDNYATQIHVLLQSLELPVGYAFRPTDAELITHHLKVKLTGSLRPTDSLMIAEAEVYKLDPWDLPGKSAIRSGDDVWYFYSPRSWKYSAGRRQNRATPNGHWKVTGEDRPITESPGGSTPTIGKKRTLVFYKRGGGRHGVRTTWTIHEFVTLNDEDGLVLCRLVKKPEEALNTSRRKHRNVNATEGESSGYFQAAAISSVSSGSLLSTADVQQTGATEADLVSNISDPTVTYYGAEDDQEDLAALHFTEYEKNEVTLDEIFNSTNDQ